MAISGVTLIKHSLYSVLSSILHVASQKKPGVHSQQRALCWFTSSKRWVRAFQWIETFPIAGYLFFIMLLEEITRHMDLKEVIVNYIQLSKVQ